MKFQKFAWFVLLISYAVVCESSNPSDTEILEKLEDYFSIIHDFDVLVSAPIDENKEDTFTIDDSTFEYNYRGKPFKVEKSFWSSYNKHKKNKEANQNKPESLIKPAKPSRPYDHILKPQVQKEKVEEFIEPDPSPCDLFFDCADRIKNFRTKLKEYKDLNDKLKSKITNLEQEKSELLEKIENNEREMINTFSSKQNNTVKNNEEINKCKIELENCKQTSNQNNCEAYETALIKCNADHSKTKQDKNTIQNELNTCKNNKNQVAVLHAAVNNNEIQLKECQSYTEELNSELDALYNEFDTCEENNHKLNTQLESCNNNLKNCNNNINQNIINTRETCNECKQQLENCNKNITETLYVITKLSLEHENKINELITESENNNLNVENCNKKLLISKDDLVNCKNNNVICDEHLKDADEEIEKLNLYLTDCEKKFVNNGDNFTNCQHELTLLTDSNMLTQTMYGQCAKQLGSCLVNITTSALKIVEYQGDIQICKTALRNDELRQDDINLLEECNDKLNICLMTSHDDTDCDEDIEMLEMQLDNCILNTTYQQNVIGELNSRIEGISRTCKHYVHGLELKKSPRGGVYYFSDQKDNLKNWYSALNACRTMGMELLSIESQEENDWLKEKIHSLTDGTDTRYWTSLGNHEDSNHWIWFGTGKHVSYNNWNNGHQGTSKEEKQCVVLNGEIDDATWTNEDCFNKYRYICELNKPCSPFIN